MHLSICAFEHLEFVHLCIWHCATHLEIVALGSTCVLPTPLIVSRHHSLNLCEGNDTNSVGGGHLCMFALVHLAFFSLVHLAFVHLAFVHLAFVHLACVHLAFGRLVL